MTCDFCNGTCGVHQCSDTLDFVCQNCRDDAQAAAWDAIHAEFDLIVSEVFAATTDASDLTTPPW